MSASAFARKCAARSGEVRCNNSSVNPSGPAAWHSIPSWFAISGADRMIDPALQRAEASRIGATTVVFDDASHAGGFTHYAARFTKLIEDAAAATTH